MKILIEKILDRFLPSFKIARELDFPTRDEREFQCEFGMSRFQFKNLPIRQKLYIQNGVIKPLWASWEGPESNQELSSGEWVELFKFEQWDNSIRRVGVFRFDSHSGDFVPRDKTTGKPLFSHYSLISPTRSN